MKTKILTLTIAAASIMLTSVTANAWSNDHNKRYDHRYDSRYDQRYNHHVDYKQMEKLKKQQAKNHKQFEKQRVQREKARLKVIKHYTAQNHWQRGQYIPVNYRAPRYVVNDWRAYHLSAPVRGNEWRRIDGRYVQVSRHNHRVYRVW